MAAYETIQTLSGALMSDERILTASERELLTNLIQRANQNVRPENKNVPDAIARMAGAIVAERAQGFLEDSITEQMLRELSRPTNARADITNMGTPPVDLPPGPSPNAPRPPGPTPHGVSYKAAETPMRLGTPPPGLPPGPSPNAPRPPGPTPGISTIRRAETISLADRPSILPAQCVLLEEFLAPEELQDLMQETLARQMEFQISEVIAPGAPGGVTDFEHRRSHVLMDLGKRRDVFLDRLQDALPRVIRKLGQDPFRISHVETQITASNHGDFFRCHSDNAEEIIASREITFVYFFHREPKQFRGGELRIYDSQWDSGRYVPTHNYRTIVPQQNQVVLFASSLAHEITPVECLSKAFADSRFTVNGWFHR